MAKFSLLTYLNAYEDRHSSNAPNRSFFKWERDIRSIFASNPVSLDLTLAPGEARAIFNGARTLTQNGSTQYTLSLVPFSTTMYQLTWTGGTAPTFRTLRSTGADATTQVTVTLNGPIVTFASTAGTPFNLISGGVVVGDIVSIGSNFNIANQGQYQIVSLTSTSFSIVNQSGVAEGPILLGSGFANQVRIFSAAGVQVGDTLVISGGFSPVTQNSYVVTQASDSYVQLSSLNPLPLEGPITTQAIAFYFLAKKLLYAESDQNISLLINGSATSTITPLVPCGCTGIVPNKPCPGMFLQTSTIYSLTITNTSINPANVFLASIE